MIDDPRGVAGVWPDGAGADAMRTIKESLDDIQADLLATIASQAQAGRYLAGIGNRLDRLREDLTRCEQIVDHLRESGAGGRVKLGPRPARP